MGASLALQDWRDRAVEATSSDRMAEIDAVVERAADAATAYRRLDQDEVDRIVWAMTVAGLEAATDLALVAIEETHFGVLEDKVIKNYVATEFLYDYLKDKRTVGIIESDRHRGIDIVAEPIGVVCAVTPVTNPTSTVLFKAIVAAKTRNAMIVRPSPHAARCAQEVVDLLAAAGEAAGMPPGALQVLTDPQHEVSHYLWRHPKVDMNWTTGGPGVVRAANEAGKPSLSVSSGNAPVYVHRSADVRTAVVDLLISKTFDSSVICPAEQTAIVDDPVYDEFLAELQRLGGVVLPPEAVPALADVLFCDGRMDLSAVGRAASEIAARVGVDVPPDAKVLLAPLPSNLEELAEHPLVREKLMPVLGVVRSPDVEHGVAAAVVVTEHGGIGHTSAVYARDEAVVEAYSTAVRTGRILVNAPTAVGALGGVYNSLPPTFSLGCGTWGGSTTTENVNYRQLLNLKTVSRRKAPPQWFRLPSDTYFNAGSLEVLSDIETTTAAVITDPDGAARGLVEAVRAHLPAPAVRVFADVEPEPSLETIRAGVALLDRFRPQAIVAVGGGSVLDAAKVMRMLHEHPDLDVKQLMLPFLDPRKRVAQYPSMHHDVMLIAIPTTAGTGSEVSPAAVITVGGRKATLVDYSLLPDRAVIDPELTLSMPPTITADSGIDALTHALEAGVSIFASPYTDAFCVQAARLIFDALPRAVRDGSDLEARTDMANAATIAGLAFSNAFVGFNHALAHAVGARFGIAHGRANAIFLPHVLRFNAAIPSKFMPAPGYGAYVAPEKYAQMGYVLFGGRTEDDRRARLFSAVDDLLAEVGMPRTIKELGVDEADFEAALPDLIRACAADPSLRTNPRMPLWTEMTELFRVGYHGGSVAL
jgi:acetaldehyde dehydrogenase / alcohol dehydrogenase